MEKVIKTKVTKTANAHETKLTIDFAGVSEDQLQELAARSIIIATQAMYRTAGSVPATDTVVVVEYLKRERKSAPVTVESLAKRAERMTPAQRDELAQLLAASLKAQKK